MDRFCIPLAGMRKCILLALLSGLLYARLTISLKVEPRILESPKFNSRHTSMYRWFEFFTLCLAPLVVHVVAGYPEAVNPNNEENSASPVLTCSWNDRLPHLNPVSIIWRYHAIADRRFRATQWDKKDMAASNAAFWDGKRWDGSEQTMILSRKWVTKMPSAAHVHFVSASTLATLAITLQGIQGAVYVYLPSTGSGSLPTLFQPLAILGLIRLLAAFWLSSEYGYNIPNDGFFATLPSSHIKTPAPASERVVRPSSRKGIIYRMWWMISLLGISEMALQKLIPVIQYIHDPTLIFTASGFLQILFYNVVCVGSLVIHGVYVMRGKNETTIIPCIQSTWYKIFNYSFIVLALGCVVFSALETCTDKHNFITTYKYWA